MARLIKDPNEEENDTGFRIVANGSEPTVINNITISNGLLNLSISNCTAGITNWVMYSTNLVVGHWEPWDCFISQTIITNWSHLLSSEWNQLFIRVKTEN